MVILVLLGTYQSVDEMLALYEPSHLTIYIYISLSIIETGQNNLVTGVQIRRGNRYQIYKIKTQQTNHRSQIINPRVKEAHSLLTRDITDPPKSKTIT